MLYIGLVVLHVVFGAMWFGAPLVAGSTIKSALAAGASVYAHAAGVVAKMARLGAIGVGGGLVTGVGLIFVRYGGMAGTPVRFHIALGLGLVASGVAFGLLVPTARKLADASGDVAAGLVKRVSMAVGIHHLLWLICLVLMFAA